MRHFLLASKLTGTYIKWRISYWLHSSVKSKCENLLEYHTLFMLLLQRLILQIYFLSYNFFHINTCSGLSKLDAKVCIVSAFVHWRVCKQRTLFSAGLHQWRPLWHSQHGRPIQWHGSIHGNAEVSWPPSYCIGAIIWKTGSFGLVSYYLAVNRYSIEYLPYSNIIRRVR